MAIDSPLERTLRACDSRTVRLFVASCAERLTPVFGAIRGRDERRSDDVALVVETLDELWDPRLSPASLGDRLEAIQSLEELQPNELGISAVDDTYAVYAALVLMYATKAAVDDDVVAASSCSHACLAALGQLDQNIEQSSFYQEESERQAAVLEFLMQGIEPAEIREEDRALGRQRLAVIVARLT